MLLEKVISNATNQGTLLISVISTRSYSKVVSQLWSANTILCMCKVFQLEILTSFGNCSSCWMVTELQQFQWSTKRKLHNYLWWTKGTHSQSFLSQLFQNYCFTSVIWGRKFLCSGSSHRSSKALLFWAGVFENLDIKKTSVPDGISARVHKETAISSIAPFSKKALY